MVLEALPLRRRIFHGGSWYSGANRLTLNLSTRQLTLPDHLGAVTSFN